MFVSAIASLIILYPAHLVSFAKSLVFPIFLLLLKKHVRIFYVLLFVSFLLSLVSSYYVTLLHFDTAFYFPFTRAWELLIGSFAALILRRSNIDIGERWGDLLSLLGLSLILYSFVNFDSETIFPSLTALIPVTGAFLFILFSQQSDIVKKIFSSRVVVFTGLISFSLYLWHQPIFALARQKNLYDSYLYMLLIATFVLSCFSYFFIERPFRDKSVVSINKVLLFSVVGAVVLIAMGTLIVSKNGFPDRFEAEDRKLLTQLSDYKGYNPKRFRELQLAKFNDSSKTNVVIIGDSFAKDFLNIVIESAKFENYAFSTHEINEECGNLFLGSYVSIQKYIPLIRRERCKVLGRYENEELLKLLGDADEIWIVASWLEWVVELLPESIDNLNRTFNKTVRVFGNKNFGKFEPYSLLGLPSSERASYVQPAFDAASQISQKLDDKMSGYQYYYSLLDPLCGGNSMACKIFTPDGLLVSVDGEHLTKEGAIEAASRMSEILTEIGGSVRP